MKELTIKGDPGQGNHFEEKTYEHIDDYYDHPTIYHQERNSRMASDFQRLRQEILKGVKSEIIEELKQYITILDGTKPFEEKLEDGGFKPAKIEEASRQMLLYAKKAEKLDCYPSAQQIFSDLFAFIKNEAVFLTADRYRISVCFCHCGRAYLDIYLNIVLLGHRALL